MDYNYLPENETAVDFYAVSLGLNRFLYKKNIEVRDILSARKFMSKRTAKQYALKYFDEFKIVGCKLRENSSPAIIYY